MSCDLVFLFISLFTWGIGEGMFFYFQPIYLQQLGADTMMIASVFSAFGAAMMIAHIPAGLLADRIGRKPLLVVAWSCGLLSTWVMALARTLPVFIAGMLLYGLTAFVSSPLNSYITAARGKLTPARAMTFMSASFNFGAVIGPLIGGWIGEHTGLRLVYFIAACLFIVSTGILLFIKSQPRDHHDPESPPARLLTNTRFIGFLSLIFFAMFVMYLPQPLTPRFLQNERGLSLVSIGLLGSTNSLGNALLNLLLGQLGARLGFLLSQVCVGLFALLLWQGRGMPWYTVGYFLLGGFRVVRSFILAQVRLLIHPSQMGLAYGMAMTFDSLSAVLAPLLAGILYTRDPAVVYPISLGLGIVALLASVLFAPRQVRESPPLAARSLDP